MVSESVLKRVLILSGAVIGIVALLYFAYYALGQRGTVLHSTQTKEFKLDVSGKLYLSLTPGNGSAPSGIYTYLPATASLNRIFADINSELPTYHSNASPTPSNDGSALVFVRKGNTEAASQVYMSASDGSSIIQVTKDSLLLKRAPVLSPDKKYIAFEASSDKGIYDSEIGGTPNGWEVYLSDVSGNTLRVATGTNPLFSPNGEKLLVLSTDGLHLFDIHDRKNIKDTGLVMQVPGSGIYRWARVSLSHDGSRIVMAVPSAGKVFVAKIGSWSAFSPVIEKTIPVVAYQAVFSPDDARLALEEVRPSLGKVDSHIVISIYDLASGQSSDAINLSKYVNALIRLGGWVE